MVASATMTGSVPVARRFSHMQEITGGPELSFPIAVKAPA
jgi:hypothetical protein